MKMEQTECSETSAYKLQTPGNYLKENTQQITVFHENVLLLYQYACYVTKNITCNALVVCQ